jgi:cell wall-associated NlpC family hydrolase
MSIEMEERLRVVRVAQSWLGTPYHHHAALRGVGVDCAYLLIEVYAEAEVIPRRDPGYYPRCRVRRGA